MITCRFSSRLVDLKECSNFMESGADVSCHNLHDFVKNIKENYGLKYAVVSDFLVCELKH